MIDRIQPPEGAPRGGPLRELQIVRRLLAIIAVLLVLGALRITKDVMLPVAFALFLVALFWPLQRRLERRLPRAAALGGTMLVLVLAVAVFVGALWLSADVVIDKAPRYQDRIGALFEQARAWAETRGIPFPGGQPEGGTARMLQEAARRIVEDLLSFGTGAILVLAFLVLGLLEVRDTRAKLEATMRDSRRGKWVEPAHRIAADFGRYMLVRTAVGAITGVAIGLFSLVVGLDFALIWGVMNFLLNYIPTLGSIVGVIPPTLFAFIQYDGLLVPLLIGAGVTAIQLVMGAYVDPRMQGRYLSLSPFAVLLAVTFWGWMWGIAGAFISMPIMVAVAIACAQFDRTRWLATLLAEWRPGPGSRGDGAAGEPYPAPGRGASRGR